MLLRSNDGVVLMSSANVYFREKSSNGSINKRVDPKPMARRMQEQVDSNITASIYHKMKLFTSLLALLPLLATSFAAKKSASTDVFAKYHSKALSTGSISLTDTSYEELTTLPRNHSVIIILTALEARFGCKICQEFKPEWDILSKSWINGDKSGNSRLLFGELDFEKGRQTFEKVCSLPSAVLLHYHIPQS
jgi:hypothetical protein